MTFVCRVSQGMFWIGALWLLLWNVLRWWPGEQCWAVAVVNYFTPWVAVALLPLIALTWLFRQRLLSLTLLAAVLLMAVHLVPMFVLKPSVSAPGQPLKLMTFNVHQRNKDAMAIVDVILKEDADVVALQELSPSVSEHLAQTLEEHYPYHTLRSEHPLEGQGLLSRYPLQQLSPGPDYRFQSAVVHTPGGQVTVLNIHTPSLFPIGWRRDWEQQRDFLQGITARFSEIEGPLLVVGDFNTTPQSENYALLRCHLRDAFLDSGWGFGFSYPAIPKFGIRLPWPLVRIDYVFHNDYLVSHETRVLSDSGGSDHRPVVSVLTVLRE